MLYVKCGRWGNVSFDISYNINKLNWWIQSQKTDIHMYELKETV